MRHLNLPSSKRNTRQWRLFDLVSAAFFGAVLLFFLFVFTPFGDSVAASRRQALVLATDETRQRQKLVALIEAGQQQTIGICPAEAVDHMPCEDPRRNSQLSREMNFYRERQCHLPEETPLCLIPPPAGYRIPVQWPESLHKLVLKTVHSNMPHNKIADRKGHRAGGTMCPDGAIQYIEKIGQHIPISGGVLRTALDMGCGVANFGGYLLKEDILTLSFAPRDSHKAQIQFALERRIPVLILGTRRLPFPVHSFDLMHCSRCLIPFTTFNRTYFIELDRLLRPGGYFVVFGPPVQWPKQEKEWADLQALAQTLCYELIFVDGNTVIWKKPSADSCVLVQNEFGHEFCDDSDDPSYGCPAVRNVMDMNAFFGGFAAALVSDPVWVMNIVPPRESSALGLIYDRGLIGVSHDWCEPFSTYSRTYDFIHASHIDSLIRHSGSCKNRCDLVDLMVEMDLMLRPNGTVVRDSPRVIDKVAHIACAVRWTTTIHEPEPESKGREKILVATKTFWTLPSYSH
ncbi:hypothetical protein NE237_029440 [Protea cynaroides]|uniref:Methyltransferase n=1 Tax=Protea cynaroides TaxID=273540 RepID=A0A9Q0JW92_9MAGN|nr:hypothetical protein NE237_029440 [Protea cynaroides]